MPAYRLLLGVVAPIVAVAVAVNNHDNVNVNVNDHGTTAERKPHLNRKSYAGAFGASTSVVSPERTSES